MARKQRLDVIVVASQKGGAGKTTVARNLAVAAGQGDPERRVSGRIVGLVDVDPQGSLSAWHDRRTADAPLVVALKGDLSAAIAALEAAGCDLILIDTPPQAHPIIGQAVGLARLALVPVRPSPDDLDAVGTTVDMIETAKVPFAFVVTQGTAGTVMLAETLTALAAQGRVAPATLYTRQDYVRAALDGIGVTEQAGKAADEVKTLWTYVETLLRKAK